MIFMCESNNFDAITKTICKLKGGSLLTITKLTKSSQADVEKVFTFLLSEGILREISFSGDCDACPLSKICPLKGKVSYSSSTVKVYVLTDKGRTFCKNLLSNTSSLKG